MNFVDITNDILFEMRFSEKIVKNSFDNSKLSSKLNFDKIVMGELGQKDGF